MKGNYDKDSDNKVSKEEFAEGLNKLICCGGACPFASWCERQTYELDYPDVGPFGLTVSEGAVSGGESTSHAAIVQRGDCPTRRDRSATHACGSPAAEIRRSVVGDGAARR